MAFSQLPSQIGPFLVRNVLCTTLAGALVRVEDVNGGRRQTVMLLDPDQPRWPARLRDRLPAHRHLFTFSQGAPQRVECDDRTFYYVGIESLSGWTVLDEIEREGTIHPTHRAVRLCAEAAEALTHVHGAGAAHGHLEPGCLFVASLSDDDGGHIKLLGAGLSVNASPASRAGRYRPKQAKLPRTLSGRIAADQYALGGVLHHMLTGSAPDAMSPRAALAIGAIPEALKTIVLRALSTDRRRRFSSLSTFCEALLTCDLGPAPVQSAGQIWYRGRTAMA